MIIQYSAAS